jgi:hypothetical protein
METIKAKIILNNKKFTLIILPIILIGPFLLLYIFMSLKKYLHLNGTLVAFLIISPIFFSVYYIQKKMTSKAVINFDSQKIEFKIFEEEILSNEFSFNYDQITSVKIIGMVKNTDYFLKIIKTDNTNYSFRFSKPEMSDFKDLATKFILEFNSSTEKNKIELK